MRLDRGGDEVGRRRRRCGQFRWKRVELCSGRDQSGQIAGKPGGTLGLARETVGKEGAAFGGDRLVDRFARERSEEHTSELQSLMRISYAVFCLKKNISD